MSRVYLYSIFERFWHWTQAALIIFLIITGFEVHGTFALFGYEEAVRWHRYAGWALLVLIIFAIFWHFTTGQWKQYIPSTKMVKAQFEYYVSGIFKDAPHPTKKTALSKLNPLQKFTYAGLKILVIPVQVTTGFIYLYYQEIYTFFTLNIKPLAAYIHTFGAFFLIGFVILHVYLTTTGTTVSSNIKAMVTGWEDLEEEK